MRTDILDFHKFYSAPLGRATRRFIARRLSEAWGDAANLSIAGFGYANPYLELFGKSERSLALSPGAQGVIRWPSDHANRACLVSEHAWPLPDASLDRVLIIHGLEEAPDPYRLMREVWRVLADDGRVIIVASHRRGLWSMIETTPFAHGRPYLKRQLNGLLEDTMFRAKAWSNALYFPPLRMKLLLRAPRSWERAGARVWPGLGGVLMVEAHKDLLAPVGLIRSRKAKLAPAAIAAPQPSNYARRDGLKAPPSGRYRQDAKTER